MTQLALTFPAARRSDPDTSHAAAQSMRDVQGEHALLVLNTLRRHGPMTYTEIAAVCGLERHAVGRRLSELLDAGYVKRLPITRPTPSGRKAHCYEACARTDHQLI